MHIILIQYELRLPGVHSLKEKRSIIKKLLNVLRRDYNVSAAEVDHLDLWQTTVIAVVAVGGVRESLERIERQLDELIETHPDSEIIAADRQWL